MAIEPPDEDGARDGADPDDNPEVGSTTPLKPPPCACATAGSAQHGAAQYADANEPAGAAPSWADAAHSSSPAVAPAGQVTLHCTQGQLIKLDVEFLEAALADLPDDSKEI